MSSAPADNDHISLQPRAKARQVPGSGVWSPESGRSPDPKNAPSWLAPREACLNYRQEPSSQHGDCDYRAVPRRSGRPPGVGFKEVPRPDQGVAPYARQRDRQGKSPRMAASQAPKLAVSLDRSEE